MAGRIIRLRLPVLVVTLAATAVPTAFRPLQPIDFGLLGHDPADLALNVLGFVPVGIVLAALGPLRAVLVSALLSVAAELSQVVMLYRYPAAADVLANVVGAIVGVAIAWRFPLPSTLQLTRRAGIAAIVLGLLLLAGAWSLKASSNLLTGPPLATVGHGALEGHWRLADVEGLASDSSGDGLDGTVYGRPALIAAPPGAALTLDGVGDYIDLGRPAGLRLSGSLTISAWIRPTAFPRDDAVIVSSHDGLGYQLDTTIDSGPRTVGFKLASACGPLMARYGATPLRLDTWYYVAGVYDAAQRTIDVYLDGVRDDGLLLGPVTATQRPSAGHVYIGRRSEPGFGFAGSIGDVRIYSRALAPAEVLADMRAPGGSATALPRAAETVATRDECADVPDRDDARLTGVAALLGILAAVAVVGLWPAAGALLCLAAALLAGMALFPVTPAPEVGSLLALFSLVGGGTVALALQRPDDGR
jgi:hypothetical protein